MKDEWFVDDCCDVKFIGVVNKRQMCVYYTITEPADALLDKYDAPKRLEGSRARLGTAWERERQGNVPETFLRRIHKRFWILSRI
ncbi:hypothetical protein CTI12_AA135210 [Artemisia annua]|uniref:Uncharacterized protein n=1 Tax=Artemisia annua TaxID=35608 RepID=A0A2U1PMM0_ARTAN|nr:hypothetical protein CTI12_AA135210 [Artemisia annua]